MRGMKFNIRIGFIGVLLILVVGILFATLFDLQIVRGADYFEVSQNNITQSVNIAASRGEILDRYNRVLVTNRVSYNIVISRSALLRQQNPNAILLKLIEICDGQGVEHTDTLPISDTGAAYKRDATNTQLSRMDRLLEARKLGEDMTAAEVFEALCEHYSVDPELSSEKKRDIIGVRYELELRTVLNMTDYIFAKDVDTGLIAMMKEYDLPSVNIETSSVRVYNTEYAAHILGRVGLMSPEEYELLSSEGYPMDAVIGKEGVESAFESILRGVDGEQTIQTNMDGRVTGVVTKTDPVPGENVVLTIDIGLQAAAENILATSIANLRQTEDGASAEGGAAVVIEVGTGDILACATYPTYNLETFSQDFDELKEDPLKPLLNRALSGVYEPGSTFKMVTAVAAMETGMVSSGTIIEDLGRYTVYNDYQPNCWIYTLAGVTHGEQDIIHALANSCNYFFYEAGALTGIDAISKYAYLLGLGMPTGSELPEGIGTVASRETSEAAGGSWFDGDTLQASMGQGDNSFTPLQLANYIASLAGGGNRYAAHFLKKTTSYDHSAVTYEYVPEIVESLNLSSDTIYAVTNGMRAVVTEGTAAGVFDDLNVTVAAKTGSAQTSNVAANAIFVCYAPYENPEIAVAVVVEKGAAGSQIASIAKEIVEYYFAADNELSIANNENTLLK